MRNTQKRWGELLKTKWDQAEPYNRRLVELSGKRLADGLRGHGHGAG